MIQKRKQAAPLLLLGGLLLTACERPVANDEGGTAEKTLANGLKVIVQPDHRAPVVVAQIWYKVGGSSEPTGLTGVSHVLEHMMFKGTERHGAGEFSRIIAENGGRENAFTGSDYTAYFQQLEKSRLPISFELEADRMRNLKLQAEEFRKEVQVVMEERRLRTDDQPESRVYERFMASAYRTHPYHNPIIGWMEDLEGLETADLQRWYERWYAPDNATLVVAGDVDPQQVFALAERTYGRHPRRTTAPPKVVAEARQTATRRIAVKAPAQVPYLLLGFHVPSAPASDREAWEPYALEVLAGVLDGGSAARLSRNLVRGRQIAARAGANYDLLSRYPTQFLLEGNPAATHSVAELESALLAEIEALKNQRVTAKELERVKAQVVASDVFEKDSMFYQALKIGVYETVGLDWREVRRYVARIQAVSAAQVQAVAKKFLVAENMTVAELKPQPMDATKIRRRATGGRHGGR